VIDVGKKAETERVAIATGVVEVLPATARRIRAGKIEKGDVVATARLAGIMAVKRVPEVVPLCHPVRVSSAQVEVRVGREAVQIRAEVHAVDRTGVEMEALTAVAAAALTVYDMCKSIDRGMRITGVQLEEKAGGRSGLWRRAAPPTGSRKSR
jgi:cyclic pyranopterin phosphate synthase